MLLFRLGNFTFRMSYSIPDISIKVCFALPNIIRVIKSSRIRWAVHVAHIREMKNAYNILAGKPEGRRPLGGPRRRWEDNVTMDLR